MSKIKDKLRYIREKFTEPMSDTHQNVHSGLGNCHHSFGLHDFGSRDCARRAPRDGQRAAQLLRAASQAGRRAVSVHDSITEQAGQVMKGKFSDNQVIAGYLAWVAAIILMVIVGHV